MLLKSKLIIFEKSSSISHDSHCVFHNVLEIMNTFQRWKYLSVNSLILIAFIYSGTIIPHVINGGLSIVIIHSA